MNRPDRAFTFSVEIGADTQEGVQDALIELADQMARGELEGGHGVSGGPTRGWMWAFKRNPEMTHERYFAELAKRKALAYVDKCESEMLGALQTESHKEHGQP